MNLYVIRLFGNQLWPKFHEIVIRVLFFIQHDNGYQITSAQKVRIRFWSLDSVESKGYVIALYKRATL
jgi:hypothetical protein